MSAPTTLSIVLVDDHDLFREGVRDFLAGLPRYAVVGDARTARASLQVIETARPDIVLMDIAMPGMDGVVATREIACELCLARKTVDTHLNRINRKLGLHDRAELVRLAVGIGLVHSIRAAVPWSD